MKPIILFLLLAIPLTYVNAQTDVKTIQEIEKVCTNYLDGGTNRDSVMFASAFLPEGSMMFMRNDTLKFVPLKDFMRSLKNGGEKQKRTTKIESISVYGDVAVAKLTIETDALYIHDIMQLIKTKEGWKIVNKIFYRENKQTK